MEMFGVLDLATGFEGCRFAIGIRNANNKRFRLNMHFRPQDDLGCFFWPTMPTRLAKKRLVHAEHEVLIFLYVKWASVLDIEGDYLIPCPLHGGKRRRGPFRVERQFLLQRVSGCVPP